MRRWLFSVCRWRKRVPQISHGYGFSPVWINTWARRWATWNMEKKQKNIHITAWIKLFDCRLLSRNVLANPTINPFWQRTYRHPLYKCQNGLEDVLSCNYGFLCKAENDCTHPWIEVSISAAGPNTIERGKSSTKVPDPDVCVSVSLPVQNERRTSHICMASLLSGCECESWG